MPSFNSLFRTVEHVAPGQHIREYPRATALPDQTLNIAVKQYIPIENSNPQPGDVTIIGAHANGFPKEIYEPLWEEILVRSRGKFGIRSIWVADAAFQGASGVLNEDKLGNDLITRPKFTEKPKSYHNFKFNILTTTQASTYRRNVWPSRKAAAESFRKSPFYTAWDPRVLDRWIKYGLRDLPTLIHPLPEDAKANTEKPVTLTTTKHQEVFTFSRPAYSAAQVTRLTHPDFVPGETGNYPFYRAEPGRIFSQLPYLRPSVHWIFGDESDLSAPEEIEEKLRTTGIAPGGSGGVAAGRVSHVTFHGVGHMIPMELVKESAEHTTNFLELELKRFKREEETLAMTFEKKSAVEKVTMDEDWYKHVPKPVRPPKKPQAKI
ncbi:hypothetical protein KEM56_003965 [Ascosphaera pollenicola]|nr:hypothetical protein KEM56_003965 [Ascosphaera pollenicola]